MQTLIAFSKKLQLGRFFVVLTLGFVLLLNTACNSGNAVGARPNNPPVQMGGQNNPHKAGGDGYSEYQMSTDPTVKKGDRASLLQPQQLIATSNNLVASSSERNKANASASSSPLKASTRNPLKEVKQLPEQRQEVIDRSDPNVKILEKTGNTFKEAAKHLTGTAEESIERSGIVKPN
ncbi:MAG: DUF6658 family protein [Stenomitos frigidus ULC029]